MLKKTVIRWGVLSATLLLNPGVYAQDQLVVPAKDNSANDTAVDERAAQEKDSNNFLVSFYKPTYILPFYYTSSPYQAVYSGNTPNNESLTPTEAKFQISFKVPVWQNVLDRPSNLYLAYTQVSYWQVYNASEFFRETNYEPELYLGNQLNWHLLDGWKISFFNLGVNHQSNGRGGSTERSWNRAYVEAIFAKNNWMISLKPWYPIARGSEVHNPDIMHYLGYERVLVSYKYREQTFSLEARNTIESGFGRGAIEATWSLPLTRHISGYLQLFSGYGQSLIEYDHYTNSAGIGIALSNWI